MFSKVSADPSTCYLTLDDRGGLWYTYGQSWPLWLNWQQPDALRNVLHRARCARVPGTRINASLAITLAVYRHSGHIESFQVCSPGCCPDVQDRRDPSLFLYSATVFTMPPSVGGWHEFSAWDIASYVLANQPSAKERDQALQAHPAWPSLSFITALDRSKTAELLGLILDPRWFVDPYRPDRSNRLERYLGLDPDSQWAVENRRITTTREKRCALVCDCWNNQLADGKSPRKPAGGFLARCHYNRGNDWHSELYTSKRFLTYLRWTWLDGLNVQAKGRLFVPELFFGSHDEAEAYRQHCRPFFKRHP